MRIYYAQNKEDLFIGAYFPDIEDGFYVDIGANDPELDSVTKLFYDKGWHGINVEPILRHYKALQEARPRDLNLRIGLSNSPGKLRFREYVQGDGLSTFDQNMVKQYEAGNNARAKKYKEYDVEVKTLAEIMDQNKVKHVHFMKIDVEGYEYEVIAGNDWSKYRPELLCIEANHIAKDWRPLLKKAKYTKVFFDGINEYYLAQESMHREKFFDYPQAIFAGNPIYAPAFHEAQYDLQVKNSELLGIVSDRESQILLLQKQQRDVKFLAKRLFDEVQMRLNKRAMRTNHRRRHVYKEDKSIAHKIQTSVGEKHEALRFIHQQDRQNVILQKTSPLHFIKQLFWKLAAKLFLLIYLVVKKVGARIR